jgi:hypothetical protein
MVQIKAIPKQESSIPNRSLDHASVLTIIPNPASDFVKVRYKIDGIHRWRTIQIYDILGSLVRTAPDRTDIFDEHLEAVFDIHTLNTGAYIIRILDGEKVVSGRFILSR